MLAYNTIFMQFYNTKEVNYTEFHVLLYMNKQEKGAFMVDFNSSNFNIKDLKIDNKDAQKLGRCFQIDERAKLDEEIQACFRGNRTNESSSIVTTDENGAIFINYSELKKPTKQEEAKLDKYVKNLEKKAKEKEEIANTKKVNDMTYNEAKSTMSASCSNIYVKDEKTGKTRTANIEEALKILKQQAENNPSTKEIYENYLKAYNAAKALEKQYPILTENLEPTFEDMQNAMDGKKTSKAKPTQESHKTNTPENNTKANTRTENAPSKPPTNNDDIISRLWKGIKELFK